jgi:hypothetical protein
MGIGSFFRIPEYSVFNYRPRYYDPEKEERRNKLREMRIYQGKNPDIDDDKPYSPGANIKGSFRPRMSQRNYRQRSSTVRFLVILAFLFFLAYLILVADLSSIINYFSK